jgi:hypothetical protein
VGGTALKCVLLGAVALALSACGLTVPATNVTSTSAIFHATGTFDGSAAHVYFEYSTRASDIRTPAAQRTPRVDLPAKPAGTPATFDAPVSGLQPDTKYYYDLCGADGEISWGGGDTCDGRQFSLMTLPASATPVTVNGRMQTGTISSAGHFATWSFTGKAGQVVAPLFNSTLVDTQSSPTTSVQDAAGNKLPATQGTYTLSADGTYTVVLDGAGGTGSVSLGVYDAAPRMATVGGPPVDVPILAGQQTTVSFTASAGEQVAAELSGPFSNLYFGDFPTLTLVDSSGNTVAGPTSAPGTLASAPLPATGTYKLVVDSNRTTTLGRLSLTSFQDQHGNISVNGQSVTANISVPGQRDFFAFAGTAGQVVGLTFGLTTYSDFPPDLVQIQDPSGAAVSGDNYTYTLPSTGTYNVVIGTQPGSASLKLSSPPVSTPPGTIIANGPIVDLSVPSPTTDVSVNFTGTAGEQVSIGVGVPVIGSIGAALPTASIKDPSGAVVPGSTGSIPSLIGPVTLPSDGTYTFEVSPNGGTGVLALHLTTPESGSGASAQSTLAPRARAAAPLTGSQCNTPAVQLLKRLYAHDPKSRPAIYYGRDAWCLAPRSRGG